MAGSLSCWYHKVGLGGWRLEWVVWHIQNIAGHVQQIYRLSNGQAGWQSRICCKDILDCNWMKSVCDRPVVCFDWDTAILTHHLDTMGAVNGMQPLKIRTLPRVRLIYNGQIYIYKEVRLTYSPNPHPTATSAPTRNHCHQSTHYQG